MAHDHLRAGRHAHLRPDAGYVSDIKVELDREDGLSAEVAGAMILDHIIPLALGRDPRDSSNVQLRTSPRATARIASN